jgi:hypothetical protein
MMELTDFGDINLLRNAWKAYRGIFKVNLRIGTLHRSLYIKRTQVIGIDCEDVVVSASTITCWESDMTLDFTNGLSCWDCV